MNTTFYDDYFFAVMLCIFVLWDRTSTTVVAYKDTIPSHFHIKTLTLLSIIVKIKLSSLLSLKTQVYMSSLDYFFHFSVIIFHDHWLIIFNLKIKCFEEEIKLFRLKPDIFKLF